MSLLTVVQSVCAAVGVARPTSVFAGINSNRTMQEMVATATEVAQKIAYDHRAWGALVKIASLSGGSDQPADFDQTFLPLPADYKRMTLTSQVRRDTQPTTPLRFIADADQWWSRRVQGFADAHGEWMLLSGGMYVSPRLWPAVPAWQNAVFYTSERAQVYDSDASPRSYWRAVSDHTSPASGTFAEARSAAPGLWAQTSSVTESVTFAYLEKNCIWLGPGGKGDAFQTDEDNFALDERLLKLGMIWTWKANKGSPYAEDLATYEDALSMAAGADKPAPILIGRVPISSSFPGPYPYGV